MILFAEDVATPAPFDLTDLPDDIRPPAPVAPMAEFAIGRRDDSGTGYTFVAVMSLTMEQLRNWESALAPRHNAGAFRFFMAPDAV